MIPFRIILFGLSLVVVAIVGYGLYWQHKMAPLMEAPQAKVVPTTFIPIAVGETRKINLGYGSVSLPIWIKGDPVRLGDSGAVEVGATRPYYPVVFMAPTKEDDKLPQMLAPFHEQTGGNNYELKKLWLAQQPFSVWKIPFLGSRKASYCLTLLGLKCLSSAATKSVSILETNGLGIFVESGESIDITVEIHDLKMGTIQDVLIDPKVGDVREIVSAIADSYELHLKSGELKDFVRQIEQAGILPAPVPESPASNPVAPVPAAQPIAAPNGS